MVYGFLDGDASVADLADDFSDVLGIDRDDVEQQVLGFVRELGENGLLAGVAPEFERDSPSGAWEPGTPVTNLSLRDLDEVQHSLQAQGGRRVALLNWSPTCGFCSRILPELVALAGPLAESGVDLVFLTAGDAESNRTQFADAGSDAVVVMR